MVRSPQGIAVMDNIRPTTTTGTNFGISTATNTLANAAASNVAQGSSSFNASSVSGADIALALDKHDAKLVNALRRGPR